MLPSAERAPTPTLSRKREREQTANQNAISAAGGRLEAWPRRCPHGSRRGEDAAPHHEGRTLASPIRRVTPRRHQQRYVEMAFGIAHRKPQRDLVEKRRGRHPHPAPRQKFFETERSVAGG